MASRCEGTGTEWSGRISALVATDDCSASDELLRRANLLLSDDALRSQSAPYEAQLDEALVRPVPGKRRTNLGSSQGVRSAEPAAGGFARSRSPAAGRSAEQSVTDSGPEG